jgi:predicted Zn-dependent peptidase
MSRESASSRASQLARQMMLHGRPVPKEELMDRLSNITVERVTDLASRLFSTTPTITGIGPLDRLASYDRIRDLLASQPAGEHKIAV